MDFLGNRIDGLTCFVGCMVLLQCLALLFSARAALMVCKKVDVVVFT